EAASSGAPTRRTRLELCAAAARGSWSPTTTKAGPVSRRARPALTTISGPMPAGSPRLSASGAGMGPAPRSTVLDAGGVAQVAQFAVGDHHQLLLGQPVLDVVAGGRANPGGMASAQGDQVKAGVGPHRLADLVDLQVGDGVAEAGRQILDVGVAEVAGHHALD